jgi:hypothetical protein
MRLPVRTLNKQPWTANNRWYFSFGVGEGKKLAWAMSRPVNVREIYTDAQYKSTFSHVTSYSVTGPETVKHSTILETKFRYFGQATYAWIYVYILDGFQTNVRGYGITKVSHLAWALKGWPFKAMWHHLLLYLLHFEVWHLLCSFLLICIILKDTTSCHLHD